MIYEYHCAKCETAFDVIKSAKEMEAVEHCKQCGSVCARHFVPSRVYFNGTKVEHAEYNPGLGTVVRNSSHRKELAKIKGVEEVGNEPVESLHKYFEKAREDKVEKSWSEVDKGWVGNGE